jgi:hypothetical protein
LATPSSLVLAGEQLLIVPVVSRGVGDAVLGVSREWSAWSFVVWPPARVSATELTSRPGRNGCRGADLGWIFRRVLGRGV